MLKKTTILLALGIAVVVALALLRRRPHITPATVCGTENGTGCAPESTRVDLAQPTFSNPTRITNPLFPASEVTQTILLGNVDGQTLRVEYTLLPGTKSIEWNGQKVETRVLQYVAYL